MLRRVYEAFILEVKSTAPEVDLKRHQLSAADSDRWSCARERVTPPALALDAVSHGDKGDIRSKILP